MLLETGGPSTEGATTFASLAVCTVGRDPAALAATLASFVRWAPGVQATVVDQTAGPGLDEVFRRWPGVRRLRTEPRGVSRARNLALRAAASDVVVFTDDDCELREGMVEDLVQPFRECPATGIAFGSVMAEEPVNEMGFIPTYEPPRPRMLYRGSGKFRDGGIGACMALNRRAAIAAGGFDQRLGPGTKQLPACEEGELAYRLLKLGYGLAHRPRARVLHHGRRPWPDGRRYAYDTFRGVAGAYSLHAWRGDAVAAGLVAQQFGMALWTVGTSAVRGRPTGISRVAGLVAGIGGGLRLARSSQAELPW